MERILVIQTASIGDVILSTPVLEKLHSVYPDATLDFLLKKGNESIFHKHPYLHHIIGWNKTERKYKGLLELIKIIRQNKYDLVINIQRFASSGLITVFSGARTTVGFNKNPFSLFFSRRIRHNIGKSSSNPHETERNLDLVSWINGRNNYKVKIYPSKRDHAKVSQYKTMKYVTVAPASLWFTKQFPAEKWVDLLDKIDPDLQIYLLGAPSEKELCDRIIRNTSNANCLSLAGKLSLLESAALMKDAWMNYVNDSAPMHLASGVNAKVTAIYCSTVPEFGFGPLSEKSFIVQAENPPACKPCGLHGFQKCPEKHFDCAYLIDINQLIDKL